MEQKNRQTNKQTIIQLLPPQEEKSQTGFEGMGGQHQGGWGGYLSFSFWSLEAAEDLLINVTLAADPRLPTTFCF